MEIKDTKENVVEKEQLGAKEQLDNKENLTNKELFQSKETGSTSLETDVQPDKDSDESDSPKQKNQGDSNISSAALGATGAVAAIVVVLVAITNVVASFINFAVYGTYFDYSIETTVEYTPDASNPVDLEQFDTGLRLIVFNQDFDAVVELTTSNAQVSCVTEILSQDEKTVKVKFTFSGKVEGLKENTRYKAQIIGQSDSGDTKVYETKSFKTTGKKTEFNSIDAECKCTIDGNFYFKLNYVDENAYYTNFRFEMINNKGVTVLSGDITNPDQQQFFDVSDFQGTDYVLRISFDSADPGDVANGESHIEIDLNVKL